MIEKYSHCKSSDTIDDTKLDCSSDTDISRETDSGSEYAYSSSEENSNNVTFHRWQILEKKITEGSTVDVTFKDAAEMFRDDIKTLKEHISNERKQANAYHKIKAPFSGKRLNASCRFCRKL